MNRTIIVRMRRKRMVRIRRNRMVRIKRNISYDEFWNKVVWVIVIVIVIVIVGFFVMKNNSKIEWQGVEEIENKTTRKEQTNTQW